TLNCADGTQYVYIGRVFKNVTPATGGEHRTHIGRVIMHGQDDYTRGAGDFTNSGEGPQTPASGHREIEHNYVRFELTCASDYSSCVRCLSHNFHVRLLVNERAQSGAHHGVVVRQQDTNFLMRAQGNPIWECAMRLWSLHRRVLQYLLCHPAFRLSGAYQPV